MTKKKLKRLRRMKEVEKQNAEVKPDYTEGDNFWDGIKNLSQRGYKLSLKEDRLSGDDLAEWRREFMEEMRSEVWTEKKELKAC